MSKYSMPTCRRFDYYPRPSNPCLLRSQPNVPECDSSHNAVSQMNTKNSKETLDVTGVAGVVCGRHALVRPNGVADLQKGER